MSGRLLSRLLGAASVVATATFGAVQAALGAATSAVSFNGQKATNLGTPTASTDGATKGYVDSQVNGLTPKTAVRVATTAAIANLAAASATIDGVTCVAGDRVLVKDTASIDGVEAAGAKRNGIYSFGTITAGVGALTRTSDANTAAEIGGASVFVAEGTANSDTSWGLGLASEDITLETTSLTFVKVGYQISTATPQALGAAAAGTVGQAADAGHVHPTTGLALSATTISASGLATGGGSLAANRTITVTAGAAGDIASLAASAAAGATGKAADAGHQHPLTGIAGASASYSAGYPKVVATCRLTSASGAGSVDANAVGVTFGARNSTGDNTVTLAGAGVPAAKLLVLITGTGQALPIIGVCIHNSDITKRIVIFNTGVGVQDDTVDIVFLQVVP